LFLINQENVLSKSSLVDTPAMAVKTSNQVKEVVVLGAGPYGLSAAAHLLAAGVEPYVIGQSMAFWKENMPGKMFLRSKDEASNIAAPQKHLSFKAYEKTLGRRISDPVPIEDFVAYGDWFQKQVAPNLDTRRVQNVSHDGGIFNLTFEDGDRIQAKSLILALGIGPFYQRPEQFAAIPQELAPHSAELNDFSRFRGKRVAVIGKGQSALEYAALMHETQAQVEVITRAPALIFRPYAWRKHFFRKMTSGPLLPLSYRIIPPTDLGDWRTSRKMAHPELFQKQTREHQLFLINACARPIGAYWLQPRLKGVRIRTSVTVTKAVVDGKGLKLDLSDGTVDRVDYVVLATGYKIDISKYRILDSALQAQIQRADGYPVLDMNLQTSVKGLYMAGVIGERTLGPTLRFVTGTSNAGPRLAAAITGKQVSGK
jgi:thioredoxin reductase